MPSSTISSIDEATRFIASNQIAGWDYSPALEAAVATINSKPTQKFVEESLPTVSPGYYCSAAQVGGAGGGVRVNLQSAEVYLSTVEGATRMYMPAPPLVATTDAPP